MKWGELTAPDFVKALEEADGVCLLPFGVIEKHGPAGPLGTDLISVRHATVSAAQMVSADILRRRYRESYEVAGALEPDQVLGYTVPLPHADHTFEPGHRLMVQVESTWFPLYDRNPQTFVPSIMTAPDSAYRAQRHRVHHSAAHPTHVELLVDEGATAANGERPVDGPER